MGRSVFAADTHILRITRWLSWYPPNANPIKAQAHLEARIPDELKFSLHQLFIKHGRTCPRCIAGRNLESKSWDDGCEIDHLVKRIGKYRGDSEVTGAHETRQNRRIPRTNKAKKRKRKDYDESESSLR
jgi:endonuclease III